MNIKASTLQRIVVAITRLKELGWTDDRSIDKAVEGLSTDGGADRLEMLVREEEQFERDLAERKRLDR